MAEREPDPVKGMALAIRDATFNNLVVRGHPWQAWEVEARVAWAYALAALLDASEEMGATDMAADAKHCADPTAARVRLLRRFARQHGLEMPDAGDQFRAKAASDPAKDRERDLAAAWRATLGTAATLADEVAAAVERANTRASGRGVTQRGEYAAHVLRGLAGELFAMRDRDPRELDVTMAGLLGAPWPPPGREDGP